MRQLLLAIGFLALLLTPLVGAGNFTAEVQADVNLDETSATRESFDKDGRLRAINPESGYFGVAPGTGRDTNANAIDALTRKGIALPPANVNLGYTKDVSFLAGANFADGKGNATPIRREIATLAAEAMGRDRTAVLNGIDVLVREDFARLRAGSADLRRNANSPSMPSAA